MVHVNKGWEELRLVPIAPDCRAIAQLPNFISWCIFSLVLMKTCPLSHLTWISLSI